ncbi:hypothetical protein BSLG_010215 [Batrachochytrium salamandrivorans]|nr:hypothetical protein BSLG_010215 [Batrachochytrium salamandrivorans]
MAQTFARQVADRFPLRLGTPQLKAVAALSAPENLTVTGSTLAPFLVPRVSGTEGNKNVQKHIIDTFTELGWGIEQDQFSDSTPFGVKHFNNIIVTKDPAALRKLVLAAHFDSKYFEEFEFIGATDSSVPCAILVDIAKTINELLQEKIMSGDRFATIQIIFFDGEEAFVKWTDTDSIYGSRHLAKKWSETQLLTNSDPSLHLMNSHDPSGQYYTTPIKQIDAMVLLDLLGSTKKQYPKHTSGNELDLGPFGRYPNEARRERHPVAGFA